MPELTEWVAKKCALERLRSNDEGNGDLTLEAVAPREREQAVAPDLEEHTLGYGQEEPIVLSDDNKEIPAVREKLPSTKEVSKAESLTTSEVQESATKSTSPPKRNKRLRTEIERLLDINWGGNSTAIIRSLDQGGIGNPSPDFLSSKTTTRTDLGPAAKRTRSARNSLHGLAQLPPNSTQKSENPPAKITKPTSRKPLPASLQPPPLSDKPYQPNTNATSSEAQNMASVYPAKPSGPTTKAQQKPKPPRASKPKSRSKSRITAPKNLETQTYLSTDHSVIPFHIKVIFNRYPTLYRIPRRQKRLDSPKLDIHSLIYRCRRAARNAVAVAGKKGKGEDEGRGEVRENRAMDGEEIVFLRRNAARGRSIWGGK